MGVDRKRCEECEHFVLRTTGDRIMCRLTICTFRGYERIMYLTACPKEQEKKDERTDSN